MSDFNRWGCTVADVLAKFKTGEYVNPDPDDLGGDDEILAEIDAAVSLINGVLPTRIFQLLTDPQLEEICSAAVQGQTVLRLGLGPIVAGSASLWTGYPDQFKTRPVQRYDYNTNNALVELPSDGYVMSVGANPDEDVAYATLTTANALQVGMRAYATYRLDVASEYFRIGSLAQVAALGAAGVLGAKVYSRESATWEYVTTMQSRFTTIIEAMGAGTWTPEELRLLRWWSEAQAEPNAASSAGGIGSVPKYRG